MAKRENKMIAAQDAIRSDKDTNGKLGALHCSASLCLSAACVTIFTKAGQHWPSVGLALADIDCCKLAFAGASGCRYNIPHIHI